MLSLDVTTERKLLSGLPGLALGMFFSMHPLLQCLIALQLADFVTGFLVAWSARTVSSDASRKGFVKKAVALILVLSVKAFADAYKLGIDLSAMLAGWFCVTELISITENAARAGWKIPRFLKRSLRSLQDEDDRNTNEKEKK